MRTTQQLIFFLVLACFFISGMAGLVYQAVWARYLALLLGHTSYAVVAVLVAFMGGLAVGNAWMGRWADRTARPLALYGILEIAIGVYALIFPSYFSFCQEGFVALARQWQPGAAGSLALKFIFSLLTIFVPTVMMGATLPTLTRFVTRSLAELRQRVAHLYAINSAGAVAGCFVAAFWWIPQHGLELTVFGGAALNLIVGIVALALSRGMKEGEGAVTVEASSATEPDQERFTPRELRLALIGIGVSGFVAMLYEVAWTRLLALALGSSTHAFSIMLITFITGITAGSWLISRRKKLRSTMRAFAWAELALAGSLFVSMFWYDRLPFWFVTLANLLARRPEAYPLYELLQTGICFAAMFVPTVCLGMTLPLVSRIATEALSTTGQSVGKVFAVNTVGTVLGALLTGLWIMPAFGLARTFSLGITLNAAVGFLLLAGNQRRDLQRALALSALLGLGMIWFAGAKLDQSWQRIFTLGMWRFANVPTNFAEFQKLAMTENMTFYKDGASATVSVYGWEENGAQQLSLKVNGKTDANSKANVPTQLLAGHLPMLLHPEARRALVVGLGSGMTCSAVARHPTIQSLDVVEISPEVVQAARMFAGHNDRVLDNPRMHLTVEDAKTFLQITSSNYDVIISEPSNPWIAGVAGVFSREYYEQCRDRLTPGGLMVQWVHLDDISDEAVNIVLATFTSVFPYTSVWHGLLKDLILVGSPQPVQVDLDALSARFQHPAVLADLGRFGLTRVPVLLGCELISQANSLFLPAGETRLHSDFHPVLEFVAQKAFFARDKAEAWRAFDETASPRPTTWLARYLQKHPLSEADFHAFAEFYAGYRLVRPQLLRSLARRWQQERPEDVLPLEITTLLAEPLDSAEGRALSLTPFADRMHQLAQRDPELLRTYVKYLMQAYRSQRSVYFIPPAALIESTLSRLLETDPLNRRLYNLYLAELAWDRGDDPACLRLGQAAFDPDTARSGPIRFALDPAAPEIALARMIETLLRAGKLDQAWELGEQARAGGYIDFTRTDSLLAMTYRKAAFARSGTAPRTTAGR